VPAEQFKDNMKVSEIPMLFSVETFCKLIISAVDEQKAVDKVS
jgi:acyl carrier protein